MTTLNRRLQRAFVARGVERSRYENGCLRDVLRHLRAASGACVAAVRGSGLFHLSTPGGETTLGILDPDSRKRLDAVVDRCAGILGTVAAGGMRCLGAHLPAFAELELRQIPAVVNELARDAVQAAELGEAAEDLLERAQPGDDGCTWVTIRGHPVCIGGAGHGRHGPGLPRVRIARSSERAWAGGLVRVRTKMTKRETGKVGEAVAIAWLQSRGLRDARPLNAHAENFGADVIAGNQVIEVKAGRAGNSVKAQQWRLTIGEPGKREKAWLRTASARAKRAWNERKERMIVARKNEIVREVGRALGRRAVGRTITTIVNPDTKVVDVYSFEGFHSRIGWSSAQAREAYVGSVRYSVRLHEGLSGDDEPDVDEPEDAVTLTGVDDAVPDDVEDEFADELERDARRYEPALKRKLKQQADADGAVALLDAVDAEPELPEDDPEHLKYAALVEYVVKVKGGYRVVSHQTGRNFGTYPTRAAAQRRLRQLARFREATLEDDPAALTDEDRRELARDPYAPLAVEDPVALLEAPEDDDIDWGEEVGRPRLGPRNLFPPPAPHLGAVFSSVPEGQVAALLASPLGGARYADAFADMAAGLLRRVRNVLTTGLIQGRGVGSVAKDVQAAVGGARFAAERIVRSEFVRVAATSALQVFDANKAALNGVQWVATLDDASCLQCGLLDGTVYEDPEDADVPVDDTHPNCRCVLVPVVAGADELGFGPATRASVDGQVPATLTYADWFAGQDAATQRDILGPARYRLFKAGHKLGSFVSAHGVKSVRDVLAELGESTADYHLAERAAALLEAWDPELHPRDERGRWAEKVGGKVSGGDQKRMIQQLDRKGLLHFGWKQQNFLLRGLYADWGQGAHLAKDFTLGWALRGVVGSLWGGKAWDPAKGRARTPWKVMRDGVRKEVARLQKDAKHAYSVDDTPGSGFTEEMANMNREELAKKVAGDMVTFARAQYAMTQRYYGRQKTVTLYRVTNQRGVREGKRVDFGSLASFTLHETPRGVPLAGPRSVVVKVEVPVKDIFASYKTGLGTSWQKEFLVMSRGQKRLILGSKELGVDDDD